MAIPDTRHLSLSILGMLASNSEQSSQTLRDHLIQGLDLTSDELRERHNRGKRLENGKALFDNNFDLAIAYLNGGLGGRPLAGLEGAPKPPFKAIVKVKNGLYKLTTIGRKILTANSAPPSIDANITVNSNDQKLVNGTATQIPPARVLFARVGNMTYYAGPQAGDERPKGGGRYNKIKLGHEVFNFAQNLGNPEDLMYGFIQPGGKSHRQIKLERIDPIVGPRTDALDNVTVIFVSRKRIIGWYFNALVHRTRVTFPTSVKALIRDRLRLAGTPDDSFVDFSVQAYAKNSTLLPTTERIFEVPGNVKGGFGQSNVCYLFDAGGKRKESSWMNSALSYVMKYDKENLLSNPSCEIASPRVGAIAQERAAGFQSNPEIRKLIEEYSMNRALDALKHLNYREFERTSAYKEYDYTCVKEGKRFYVEVKGTQTTGQAVILTKNEVEHARLHPKNSIIVIVHSVRVSVNKNNVHVAGGEVLVKEEWHPMIEDLYPIQYSWRVN